MSAAHTPGFMSQAGSDPHNQGQVYGHDGKTLAVTYDDDGGKLAAMFAAAPAMMEENKRLREALLSMVEAGNAVILGYEEDIESKGFSQAVHHLEAVIDSDARAALAMAEGRD